MPVASHKVRRQAPVGGRVAGSKQRTASRTGRPSTVCEIHAQSFERPAAAFGKLCSSERSMHDRVPHGPRQTRPLGPRRPLWKRASATMPQVRRGRWDSGQGAAGMAVWRHGQPRAPKGLLAAQSDMHEAWSLPKRGIARRGPAGRRLAAARAAARLEARSAFLGGAAGMVDAAAQDMPSPLACRRWWWTAAGTCWAVWPQSLPSSC